MNIYIIRILEDDREKGAKNLFVDITATGEVKVSRSTERSKQTEHGNTPEHKG